MSDGEKSDDPVTFKRLPEDLQIKRVPAECLGETAPQQAAVESILGDLVTQDAE